MGQGSLMEALGYPYITHRNLNYILSPGSVMNASQLANWLLSHTNSTSATPYYSDSALRKYHAIWIAFYRNVQIQPLTTTLDYHKWDNSFTLGTNLATPITMTQWMVMMLMTRICPWSEDMFTSAQLDDIMRHIYMPVLENTATNVKIDNTGASSVEYPIQAEATRFMTVQNISYQQANGTNSVVKLPIPSILNRALSNLNYGNPDQDTLMFDLFSLKRAHMLERFLKRGHYFGTDEYRDIIKGQYGVDISDLRLNRPHFLGGSTSMIDKQQHISTAGQTAEEASADKSKTTFGQRLVTATGDCSGDTFTDFAE